MRIKPWVRELYRSVPKSVMVDGSRGQMPKPNRTPHKPWSIRDELQR
jgi:hypothetical protein